MSSPEERFNKESNYWAERGDVRSPYQVDRDRTLYSSALARLAEITQVVSPERGHVFHNRLTHSLKVAQLARRVAERFDSELARAAQLDPEATEAAALAHDLGHPPFGHLAEEELNELCRARGLEDGFEGNAQSFRIVTRLAVSDSLDPAKYSTHRGLNFTRGTLNGLLKYPWISGENKQKPKKWGAYHADRSVFDWVRRDDSSQEQSPAAQLMDWADDVTYAVHDVMDFYRASMIPLDRLAAKLADGVRKEFFDEVFERNKDIGDRRSALEQALMGILRYFTVDGRYTGSRYQTEQIWRYTSMLISRYAPQMRLEEVRGKVRLVGLDKTYEDEIFMLKQLTWHYVILDSDLGTHQHGQRWIVRDVFNALADGAVKGDSRRLFPVPINDSIRQATTGKAKFRCVADYVASMTEREMVSLHRRLTGRR